MPQFDLSIISTVYNCENSIAHLINAVRNLKKAVGSQLGIEFVISDGESKDRTAEIINKNLDIVDKLIVKKDTCAAEGYNNAIREASGYRIAILNVDDWPESEGWIQSLSILKCRDGKILFGDVYYHFNNGTKVLRKSFPEKLLHNMTVWHVAMFAPKEYLLAVDLHNHKYKYAPDYEIALKLYKRSFPYLIVSKVFCNVAAGGMTNVNWAKALNEVKNIKITVGHKNKITCEIEYCKAFLSHSISNLFMQSGLGFISENLKGRKLLSTK